MTRTVRVKTASLASELSDLIEKRDLRGEPEC